MTILEDIQNSAVDAKSDLAALLRKCKLLAARLGSQPLEEWVIWESNGYPEHVPVPEYRVWSLEVFGHFMGPFHSSITNIPIPLTALNFIPEDVKKAYERHECRESVASIEAVLSKASGTVQVSTAHLALAIGTKLYPNHNCVQAWAEFPTGNLVELLNSVRNRILDFALAISKEAPNAGEAGNASPQTIESSRVTQIFNTAVYGGAASVVGTAANSSIAFNVTTNDFPSLERVLLRKGVSSTDIGELKTALDLDAPPTAPETFGPKVSSWIGKMVEKAAAGGWEIGIGAGGNLLGQAIAKYYGLL